MINTFHGINLDVVHPVLDDFYPNDIGPADPYAFKRVFIPAGWRHLSGRQALEYVRSRHGDLIGDFGRSTRQQQVLVQLRQKLNTLDIVRNLPALVDELQNSVRTDFGLTELYQLQSLSHRIRTQDVKRVILQAPVFCVYDRTADGQSILRPIWTRINPVVKSLFAPLPHISIPKVAPTPSGAHGHASPVRPGTPTPRPVATVTSTPTVPHTLRISRLPVRLLFIQDGNVTLASRNGKVTKITCTAGLSMPAISPDGRSVVFVRWRQFSSDLEILDLKPNMGCPVQGRTITQDESLDVHNNLWAVWPTWSADSKQILFSTDRAKLTQVSTESRPVDLSIWSVPASGGSPTQLTTPVAGAGGDTEPSVTRGSNLLIYAHWAYDQSNQAYSQLVMRDPVSGATSNLTSAGGRYFQPQVDRSGTHVRYNRVVNGTDEVDVAPILRSSLGVHLGPAVALASGKVAQPAFTPNGRWVSYLKADGDNFSLYVAGSHGGESLRVDAAGSNLDATTRPVWVP